MDYNIERAHRRSRLIYETRESDSILDTKRSSHRTQFCQCVLASASLIYRAADDVATKVLARQHSERTEKYVMTFPPRRRGDQPNANESIAGRRETAHFIYVKHRTFGIEACQVESVVYGCDLQFVATDMPKITCHAIGVSDCDFATMCVNSHQMQHYRPRRDVVADVPDDGSFTGCGPGGKYMRLEAIAVEHVRREDMKEAPELPNERR
jgi:hypothetical protein